MKNTFYGAPLLAFSLLMTPSTSYAELKNPELCSAVSFFSGFTYSISVGITNDPVAAGKLLTDQSEDAKTTRLWLTDPSLALAQVAHDIRQDKNTPAEQADELLEYAQSGQFERLILALQMEPGLSACIGSDTQVCEEKYASILSRHLPSCSLESLIKPF